MLTHFEKPEESKELYFKLSNSFHLTMFDDRSSTSKFAGLYAIFKNDVCMYVGQSQNLASRLSQHLSGKYSSADKVLIYSVTSNGFIDFFDRAKDSRKNILENNERIMIKELQPVENLLLPDDGFELPIDNRFPIINGENDFKEFFEVFSSSIIHIGKYNITVCTHEAVTDIQQDCFFEQYCEYIEYVKDCEESQTEKKIVREL